MKRLLIVLPLLLLLAGCSEKQPEQTQPATEPPTQDATETMATSEPAPTEAVLESVQLESTNVVGMLPMGEDLLLFEENKLSIVDAQTLETVVAEQIQGVPMPESGLVWVHTDGVAYYDAESKHIVFLGTNLKQTMRLQLPEDMIGTACLSPDWSTVYYCTTSEIRALDMKNGVSRLVKTHPAVRQSVSGVLLDGEVLNCVEQDADGVTQTVLISSKTGEVLYEGTYLTDMVSNNKSYYLTIDHKSVKEILFGQIDGVPQNLWPAHSPDLYQILPERNAVVTAYSSQSGVVLDYYDLTSGLRTANVCISGETGIAALVAEVDGGIWALCGQTVYLWHPDRNPVEDQIVYTSDRNADTKGNAEVAVLAQQLEQQYGVSFLMGEDTGYVAPWDYSFETERIPQAYVDALEKLQLAMANFPDDFFKVAAEKSANKKLTIILVRGIYGAMEKGTLASAGGTQYWLDGKLYMALSLSVDVESFFYHEMGHIIDTKVLSTGTAFYEWEKLNPSGFTYDNDYIANQNRNGDQYLQPSDRWFIDTYSMSFAVEDRSRIFEFASLPGNDAYFTSSVMQQKLKRVCTGVRQAFGLDDAPQQFIWEQYLKQ